MAAARSIEELEKMLREKLKETDKSAATLSNECGISKTHLINFKNGNRNLSFPNLHVLAEYFGVKYILKN